MIAGNVCAVSYENNWLRAEFLEAPVNDQIKVCFVDYGTIDEVGIEQCHHMSEDFSSIPRLCYPGSLEFIAPIDNPFTEMELVLNFRKMVRHKPLAGHVTKVDYKVRLAFSTISLI